MVKKTRKRRNKMKIYIVKAPQGDKQILGTNKRKNGQLA